MFGSLFPGFVQDPITREWKPRPTQVEPVGHIPMKLDTQEIVLRARGQSRVLHERKQAQRAAVA